MKLIPILLLIVIVAAASAGKTDKANPKIEEPLIH